MSILLNAAASITPPVQEQNVVVLGTTTSSVARAIPTMFLREEKGIYVAEWLDLVADGDDIYIAFGDSSIVVDETAVSTIASDGVVTFDGDECIKIPSGQSVSFDMRMVGGVDTITHFAIKGGSGGGYLRMQRTSGKVSA